MQLTTLKSCLAVTLAVTLFYVFGMAIFETAMMDQEGMANGVAGKTEHTNFEWIVSRARHALTTIVLVGPATLIAALMYRRSSLSNLELQRLVNRDRLTDASTRDFFFNQMEENPDSYGVSLMVDIDNFKKVNDTYGHLAGDQVIRHVAQILRQNTRSKDIVARFGGEEFIVFLNERDSMAGYELAERMRRNIASEVCNFDGLSLKVTVSIGGSMKEAVDQIERSIAEADDAMYRAKQAGRNQTVFGGALEPVPRLLLAD